MNIAFFSKHLPSNEPNGVSVQVHRLAEALTNRNHTVTVFTFSPPVAAATYTCITLPGPLPPGIAGKFFPAIRFRTVDTSRFDIVHYHGDDYLCRGSNRRVRTFYGSAFKEALHAASPGRFCYQALFYLFEWMSCLKKGHFIAISEYTRHYLPFVKKCIPCCVPLDRYYKDGMKTPYPSILFLGDFDSRKRGAALLNIFSSVILPRYPDALLTVVGPVPCSDKGIRYAGRLNEMQLINEYRRCWVFCMPSSYEGFGVPVIEAMACGTAVVAVRNSGSEALITHNANGLLCTEKTLGQSIDRVLSDAQLRATISDAGAKTAAAFDAAVIAERYERFYLDTDLVG
jgi:glycosyltransferase involved in cell wall biosynthesis